MDTPAVRITEKDGSISDSRPASFFARTALQAMRHNDVMFVWQSIFDNGLAVMVEYARKCPCYSRCWKCLTLGRSPPVK